MPPYRVCAYYAVLLSVCGHAVDAFWFQDRQEASSPDFMCRPQEGLLLDRLIAPSKEALPFCNQYNDCTCCNVSHSANIQRQLEHVLNSDDGLSRSCKAYASMIACRICDPEFGVGLKRGLCEGTCDEWYEACLDDYFAFASLSQRLQLCDDSQVLCSPLKMLAESGKDLCKKAGMQMSKRNCFDGRLKSSHGLCASGSRKSTAGKSLLDGLVVGFIAVFSCILCALLFGWALFPGLFNQNHPVHPHPVPEEHEE